jgi:hypothetical protein
MRAELTPFGFVIGGPITEVWAATLDDANAKVAELAVAEGYDEDDYTVTAVFAKAWRGSLASGEHLRDWDDDYNSQLRK